MRPGNRGSASGFCVSLVGSQVVRTFDAALNSVLGPVVQCDERLRDMLQRALVGLAGERTGLEADEVVSADGEQRLDADAVHTGFAKWPVLEAERRAVLVLANLQIDGVGMACASIAWLVQSMDLDRVVEPAGTMGGDFACHLGKVTDRSAGSQTDP